METLIYGGSFNPPTNAHEAIIRACLRVSNVDQVWVMPSAERSDKVFDFTDTDRLWMLHYMLGEVFPDEPRVQVTHFELDSAPRPTRTWRTIEALRNRYPGRIFRFVFGVDAYQDMPTWEHGDTLQATLPMLIVPRNGVELPPHIPSIPDPGRLESSTEVRQRIKQNQPFSHMVCKGVYEYIKDCGLYSVK